MPDTSSCGFPESAEAQIASRMLYVFSPVFLVTMTKCPFLYYLISLLFPLSQINAIKQVHVSNRSLLQIPEVN